MPDTINTFVIYAREDTNIKHRLLAHLNPFVKAYNLVLWHDEHLEAGQEWKPHIESRLEKTDLFLLLISVDFMNSEFINQVEFKFAIDRHKANKSIVIPIIINYCQWDISFNFTDYNFNLNELQVLPQEGKPVDDWKTPEQAYNNIAAGIRKVLETIKARKPVDEKVVGELEKKKKGDTGTTPLTLPETKDNVLKAVEKVDNIPLENSVFSNGNITKENIVTAEQSDNTFINYAGTEFEESKTGFFTRKKYIIGVLVLAVLIYIIYLATCTNNSGSSSTQNNFADSTATVLPVFDTNEVVNNKKEDAEKQSIDTPEKTIPKGPVIKPGKDTRKTLLNDEDKIFTKVEVEARFAGGVDAWRSYLRKNLNGNTPVDLGAKRGKYTVIVKFVVSKDGSLSDVTCENNPGYGMCQEALRVIKGCPNWIPATQNGRYVNAYRRQPITFIVE
jgi:TIR domain/Gram-negative bacterial TonB protein C-terminal